MAGTLFVVATPIGHLEDITLRALRTLREASVVAAEDTRRSGNLLRHYDIATPLISLHEHNERSRGPALVERLRRGDSVALVTDAGTPGISDPGSGLVRLAIEAGIRVEPIPGASAVTAALSAAGLAEQQFCFLGFPPIRSKDRKSWFAGLTEVESRTVVFYESPHRILPTLLKLGIYVNRPIIVFRELTKAHEERLEGTIESIVQRITPPIGEFTVVIPRMTEDASARVPVSSDEILSVFGEITKNKGFASRRQAARAVAQRLGVSVREVYETIKTVELLPKDA